MSDFDLISLESKDFREIFENVKNIAVFSCSPNPMKASFHVAKYLQNAGYKIIPIYPKEDKILGVKVYRSLEEVPFKIDMVDIFRKPEAIEGIVKSAIKRGDISVIWTQLDLVDNKAARLAKDNNIKVVQNKCTQIEHGKLFS